MTLKSDHRIRISLAPWIRIRIEIKSWIRIRTETKADPQHWLQNSIHNFLRGLFWIFFSYILYWTLLHLPPLRFHCVGGCWDRIEDLPWYRRAVPWVDRGGQWLADSCRPSARPTPPCSRGFGSGSALMGSCWIQIRIRDSNSDPYSSVKFALKLEILQIYIFKMPFLKSLKMLSLRISSSR